MASKSIQLQRERRSFIINKSWELVHDTTNEINTITEAYQYVADKLLFCDIRTIYRSVNTIV